MNSIEISQTLPGLERLVSAMPEAEQSVRRKEPSITESPQSRHRVGVTVCTVSYEVESTVLHAHLWQRARSETDR